MKPPFPLSLVAAAFGALAGLLSAAAWGQGTPLLRLTTIEFTPGNPVQFNFVDQGTGATNYIVEFSPTVDGGGAWSNITAAVITPLGGCNYHVMAPDPLSVHGFYRVSPTLSMFLGCLLLSLPQGLTKATKPTRNSHGRFLEPTNEHERTRMD